MMSEEERNKRIYVQRKAGYTWVYLSAKYDLELKDLHRIYNAEDKKRKEARK